MKMTIDIPDRLHKRVKNRAALAGQTMKEFVTQALEQDIATGLERQPPSVRKLMPEKNSEVLYP